jgi:hypothetical protein
MGQPGLGDVADQGQPDRAGAGLGREQALLVGAGEGGIRCTSN